MARYYGAIGYAHSVQTAPGVYSEEITEYKYYGDVIRNLRRLSNGEHLNDDLSISNSLSIVADAYAYENFFAIRYAEWSGTIWKVTSVQVQRPRLILELGGLYHAN